jgi:succinate dehydrogenase / fumarate reductase, cytochrome b subunit
MKAPRHPQPSSYPRPLSPHLQIYRPQITSILSIMHRFTGIGLSIGTLLIVLWLGSIALGPGAYLTLSIWLTSPLGQTMLLGWAFCFYYHLANGIRHLFWDAGLGFEITTVYISGWSVILCSIGLTALTFWWMIGK